MKHQLFISVHVPKTAGTSFRHYLEAVFGEQLIADYRSKPLDEEYTERAIDNSNQDAATFQYICDQLNTADVCVHGHFFPAKYLAVFPEAKLIGWTRDPAQRLMSHYQYWRQNPQPDHHIARRVLENNLSFTEFVELEVMQNINSRFFGHLRASRFDSIGISERYEDSIQAMCRRFGWPPLSAGDIKEARRNPLKEGMEYTLTKADIARVRELNAQDYSLYEEVTR